MRYPAFVTNLTILLGAVNSNELYRSDLSDAESLAIFAPAVLPEAVKIQIANNTSPVAADWRDLDEGAGDIVIAAGQVRVIDLIPFMALRLQAGVAVAADRVFNVNKNMAT